MTKKVYKYRSHTQFDVVIVGSGPAGVHAAYPLTEAGLQVAIIDGGLDSKKRTSKPVNFSETDSSTAGHAYDLLRKSSYVFYKTYQLLKIKSDIEIIQSLAKGGLSEIWDGICDFFSKEELEKIGLPADIIQQEYQEVAKLINLKLKIPLDTHGRLILQSAKNKANLKNTVYQLPTAISYRASSSIEDLKRFKNFTYIPNQLVYTVKDKIEYVEIQSFSIDNSVMSTNRANYLILAAGSVNTTRILLRSLGLFDYRTTFLTKAHFLTACLNFRTLTKKTNSKKSNFGQLAILSDETYHGLVAFFVQLYRFNTEVLHKSLKYIPLPKVIASMLLSFIISSLVIADIRFPVFESKNKFCRLLKKGDEDVLEISYKENRKELEIHRNEVNKISRQLRSLGLLPLKTVSDYVTVHYAGGVPFREVPTLLSVDKNGKLHQTNRIYSGDSSTWKALPAKSPTLTIMANARRVGKNVLRKFN